MRRLHLHGFHVSGQRPRGCHFGRHGLLGLGFVILWVVALSGFSAASAATVCNDIQHPKCRVQLITGTSMT